MKKKHIKIIISALLCLCIIGIGGKLVESQAASLGSTGVIGDANGDGKSSVADLVRVKKYAAQTVEDVCLDGDLDKDDVVDGNDAAYHRVNLLGAYKLVKSDTARQVGKWDKGPTATTFPLELDASQQNAIGTSTLIRANIAGKNSGNLGYSNGVLTLDNGNLPGSQLTTTIAATFQTQDACDLTVVYLPVEVHRMVITDETELNTFPSVQKAYPAGTYVLEKDIYCEGWYTSGHDVAFMGTFDGQGHTIYNIRTGSGGYPNRGFFGTVMGSSGSNTATLKNISFVNATHQKQGGFITTQCGGKLENVYIQISLNNLEYINDYKTTSAIASDTWGTLSVKNVVVEYKTPLIEYDNPDNVGYAIGNIHLKRGCYQGLYVIGANSAYRKVGSEKTGTDVIAAYHMKEELAANTDLSGMPTSFWKEMDGVRFPVKTLPLAKVGMKDSQTNMVLDITAKQDEIGNATLKSATLDGTAFTTATYSAGKLTLDRAPLTSTGVKMVKAVFTSNGKDFTIQIPIDVYTMVIGDSADLDTFRAVQQTYPAGHYILENNIEYNKQFKDGVNGGAAFAGTFDGRGYSINGMKIQGGGNTVHAFLGSTLDKAGTLKNVSFLNATKVGNGGFISSYTYGTIENVYVQVKSINSTATGTFSAYSSVLGSMIQSTTRFNNVFVEYTTPISGATNGYVVREYLPGYGVYNGLYVVGADNFYTVKANAGSSSTPDVCGAFSTYAQYVSSGTDATAWEDYFWKPVNGIPYPRLLTAPSAVPNGVIPTYAKPGSSTTITGTGLNDVVSVDAAAASLGVTVSGNTVTIPSSIALGTEITVTVSSVWDSSQKVSGVITVATDMSITLEEALQVGMNDEGDNFTVDLSQYTDTIKGMTPTSAKIDDGNAAFTVCSYNDNDSTLLLNRSTLTASTTSIVAVFEENGVKLTITVPLKIYRMVINNVAELDLFRTVKEEIPGGSYILGNDIEYNKQFPSNTTGTDNMFTGTFDGQGYSIIGMTIDGGGTTKHAFLGSKMGDGATHSGTIRNVSFLNAKKKGNGGFIATYIGGTVQNVYIQMDEINSTATGTNSAYSSAIASFVYGIAKINRVFVEYTTPISSATNGYPVREYLSKYGVYNGLYVVGADKFYDTKNATAGTSSTADVCKAYTTRAKMQSATIDFSAWETSGFWAIEDGIPVPINTLVAKERTATTLTTAKDTLHQVTVTENANRVFVNNKKTDYKFVITNKGTIGGADDTYTYKVLRYMNVYIKEATGIEIPVIAKSDASYSSTSKYIIVNDTDLFNQAGLTMPTNVDLGPMGYYIVTQNDNVFVMSNTEEGVQHAMLAFMRNVLGYETYAWDTIAYEKVANGKVTMPTMSIVEKPDITYLEDNNSVGDKSWKMNLMMGYNMETFLSGTYEGRKIDQWHNSTQYLPKSVYKKAHPNWYATRTDDESRTGGELCYTAHGNDTELKAMAAEVAKIMTALLKDDPNAKFATITMMDHYGRIKPQCECDACKSYKKTHGSDSAAMLNFVNMVNGYLRTNLANDGMSDRDVTVMFMAYHAYIEPPASTSTLKCGKGVGVLVAPIEAYWNKSFAHTSNQSVTVKEGTTTATRNFHDIMDGWGRVMNDTSPQMFIWMYETGFFTYLYPYNSWETSLDTLAYFHNLGAQFIMPQGQWNTSGQTGFTDLKDYINTKASVNINDTINNYDELIDNFFENYYGSGSASMLQYFNELQKWMDQMGNMDTSDYVYDGSTYTYLDSQTAAWWPRSLMLRWLRYIDAAYEAVADDYANGNIDKATYDRLVEHIKLESIFPRQVMLTNYSSYYTNDSERLTILRTKFKEDCEALGVKMLSESEEISVLWEQWGM